MAGLPQACRALPSRPHRTDDLRHKPRWRAVSPRLRLNNPCSWSAEAKCKSSLQYRANRSSARRKRPWLPDNRLGRSSTRSSHCEISHSLGKPFCVCRIDLAGGRKTASSAAKNSKGGIWPRPRRGLLFARPKRAKNLLEINTEFPHARPVRSAPS